MKIIKLHSIKQEELTAFGSKGMTRNPEGRSGALSANDSSMGAKTS